MGPFEFVLAIVAIVFGFKLIRDRMQQRQEQSKHSDSDALADQMLELEKRIRVLERIVTSDPASDLKKQFDELG